MKANYFTCKGSKIVIGTDKGQLQLSKDDLQKLIVVSLNRDFLGPRKSKSIGYLLLTAAFGLLCHSDKTKFKTALKAMLSTLNQKEMKERFQCSKCGDKFEFRVEFAGHRIRLDNDSCRDAELIILADSVPNKKLNQSVVDDDEVLVENATKLAKHHKEHCDGAECNISLYLLRKLIERADIALTDEQKMNFF
jgi:hypothetical protein